MVVVGAVLVGVMAGVLLDRVLVMMILILPRTVRTGHKKTPRVFADLGALSLYAWPFVSFMAVGAWVGIAPGPAAVQDMITAYEARTEGA